MGFQLQQACGRRAGARVRAGLRAGPVLAFIVLALIAAPALPVRATESETLSERTLKQIVARQKDIFTEADKQGDKLDQENLRAQMQSVAHDYERLLQDNPKFAAGYAAYGYMLGQVGMRKESVAVLLKANQLDPDIPLVKNQLGNYAAEEGKPLEAAAYFLAAIKLAPNEPLYHYQLGTLLATARDDFLKSGEWTRAGIDEAMHHAFQRATELAPDRFEFGVAYAKSFYELEHPDWAEALKVWGGLEEKAQTPAARQLTRLHAANILITIGKPDHARALLETVDEASLQEQKQKLIAQLAETAKK